MKTRATWSVVIVWLLQTCAFAQPAKHPNIVIIYADDLGWADVSCYASKDIHTPNIDRLASQSVKFMRWYASSPVCTPSRYALLTGKQPERPGGLPDVQQPKDPGLRPNEILISDLLRKAGYRTALVGKWHLGEHDSENPLAHGFDSFYGFRGGLINYFTHGYGPRPDWWRDDHQIVEQGYSTDLLTDEAVKLIKQQPADQPMFLYLAYNAPHYGRDLNNKIILQSKPEDEAFYQSITDPKRRAFAGSMKALDDGIGKVLAAMDDAKWNDHTWLLFASDQGAEEHWGGNNKPLRGQKHELFDGGLRVPATLRYPGVKPGEINTYVTNLDVFPSICKVANIDTTGLTLDGQDLQPSIDGTADPHRVLFFKYFGWHAYIQNEMKYLHSGPQYGSKDYLFNLKTDPYESTDLSTTQPDLLEKLRSAWQTEAKQMHLRPDPTTKR